MPPPPCHPARANPCPQWEFEAYLNNRSVSFARNGTLHIKPAFTADSFDVGSADLSLWGGDPATACTSNFDYGCERQGGANILNPVVSAALRTAETFSLRYGRVEVVAQMPAGDWLWPAIWLMPTEAAYGAWPASGEIDIAESRGNAASYAPGGRNTVGSTLHYGPYCCDDAYLTEHASYTLPSGDLSEGFHTYGLTWNSSMIQTYVDTTVVLTAPINETFFARGGFPDTIDNPWQDGAMNAPFDKGFYLILNLAVGGTNGYFPDGPEKPWSDTSDFAANEFWAAASTWRPTWTSPFLVDSVRVWQTPGGAATNTLRPML